MYKRKLIGVALGLALLPAVPALAQGQNPASVDTQRVAEAADREDRGEWGWIGLLGLVGLLGLKGRDRVDVVRRDTAATSR